MDDENFLSKKSTSGRGGDQWPFFHRDGCACSFWTTAFSGTFLFVYVFIVIGFTTKAGPIAIPSILSILCCCIMFIWLVDDSGSDTGPVATSQVEVATSPSELQSSLRDFQVGGAVGVPGMLPAVESEGGPPNIPRVPSTWTLRSRPADVVEVVDPPYGVNKMSQGDWEVELDNGWKRFGNIEQQLINAAQSRGEQMVRLRIRGQAYELYIEQRVQLNVRTDKMRPIRHVEHPDV
eukprot:TRINITY_DN37806_c0_g1_i1.p1 TRINITY_DN37806_c0_g1~~TRINITY_DN37806_c0_g1_i1.p1  ORF type:complete len:235 (-),score=15.37 TRINITY_DN37806_c0_g1_i1:106-810(-)